MKVSITIAGSSIDEVVKATERAAAAGFTSAWLANIFGVDALTAIAVAGRHVPGIHLGTAVVPTFPRHPHALAQQAMSTWDATGGRFTLGIGLSHQIVIESMFGLSYDKPAVHMREYLSVLLPLLRDGMASFSGERYTVNAPLERPATPGSPPVLIAAMAPVMLSLAGGVADGTLLWMTGPSTVADHVVPKITKAADAAGKPAPAVVAALPVAVGDADALRAEANDFFAMYGGLPSYRAMLDKEGAAGPGDVAIVGDEAAVEAGIRAMADAGTTEFTAALFGDRDTVTLTTDLLRGMV
jgi:5,10-methylenetetrahydromethanopterin reductase